MLEGNIYDQGRGGCASLAGSFEWSHFFDILCQFFFTPFGHPWGLRPAPRVDWASGCEG